MEYRICSSCKKKKPIVAFTPAKDRIGGYRRECSACWYEKGKTWRAKNSERFYRAQRKYMLSGKGYYTRLKCSARYSGTEFDLGQSEFVDWFNAQTMNCHYCRQGMTRGEGLQHTGNAFTIDRKDNQLGYRIDNIVACCRTCNKIKADIFNEQEMLEIARLFIKPKLLDEIPERWW